MGKPSQLRKRVAKKGAHEEYPFDKYDLYRRSVQSPDTDVEFLSATYKELKGKKAVTLCEDFCGTFLISCEWAKLAKTHKALSVDLDPEPLAYGKENYLSRLKEHEQRRITTFQTDVMSPEIPKADIVLAANFSYFVFKTRARMKEYFAKVLARLSHDGIFVLDCFGGSLCYDANEEFTKHRNFTYYWEQKDFDPVSSRANFSIHFKPKGGKKYENVFHYDWRMWNISELREILAEVGFSKTYVYWEGTKRNGTGDGVFKKAMMGEACQSWIAYIVGER